MVATHFQPISARSVFPCFDEPQFKTSFKISVARPKDGSLLSFTNMPIVSTQPV
jgi:aminopeptidase N